MERLLHLHQQAQALGLADRWSEVCRVYAEVNQMFGDIIKVTPTSKAVGDMALFMVQNNLSPADVIERGHELSFPDSFVQMMKGMMGQPPGGWPPELQKAVLKDEKPITQRPGELLEDFDFGSAGTLLKTRFGRYFSEEDVLSYALYPKVFQDYCEFAREYGDVSVLDSSTFFYGLEAGKETAITIEEGKTLIIKLLAVGELQPDGSRLIFYELNGRRRNAVALDTASGMKIKRRDKADPANHEHLGAPMAGKVVELAVAAAISLFGFESGAALATVVGVLIEVPAMLLVVRAVNASKGWYERGSQSGQAGSPEVR